MITFRIEPYIMCSQGCQESFNDNVKHKMYRTHVYQYQKLHHSSNIIILMPFALYIRRIKYLVYSKSLSL